jgi:hypothetical protein
LDSIQGGLDSLGVKTRPITWGKQRSPCLINANLDSSEYYHEIYGARVVTFRKAKQTAPLQLASQLAGPVPRTVDPQQPAPIAPNHSLSARRERSSAPVDGSQSAGKGRCAPQASNSAGTPIETTPRSATRSWPGAGAGSGRHQDLAIARTPFIACRILACAMTNEAGSRGGHRRRSRPERSFASSRRPVSAS